MARILIADDALFMRTLLKRALTGGGHEVIAEAENGQQAVQMYEDVKPDIVLLDITMPVVDGLQALEQIKQAHPDARIIMCTALGQQDKVRAAISGGARDYVVKPFDAGKLLNAITRALA